MKATELMIGDWVIIASSKIKVTKLSKDGEYKNCSPIPLTAEILEKNGFYYEHDYGIFYRSILGDYAKDKEPVVCVGWNSKMEMCGYDICSGTGRICAGHDALYVHQLQHALRLCGLSDLADNFQI